MKIRLLSIVIILLLSTKSFSQESTPIGTDFYYNNFATSTAGTTSSLGVNATRLATATTIDAVTNSALNGTVSLGSKNLAAVGSIRWNFMTTGTDLSANDYEWEFTYRNSATSSNNDPDAMASGNNSWRFWLICNNSTFNSNLTEGFYVTHYGTTLVVRYRYDNSAGTGRFNSLVSITLPNDQNAYSIRLRRSKDGTWTIYAQLIASPFTLTKATSSGNTGNNFHTYYYSFLESTTTSDNRFQWDDFKMYTVKESFEPVTGAANGITQIYYPGEPNVIPYGIRVKLRGDVELGRIRFRSDQNVQAVFNDGQLYKSVDDFFSSTQPATGDTYLVNVRIFSDGSNQITLPSTEKYYGASTDGSLTMVTNYFLLLSVKNSLSGAPSTFSFYMSNTADDNYSSSYGGTQNPPLTSTPASTAGTTAPANANVYDWKGASSTWATAGNWLYNGSTSSTTPGASDLVRISSIAYTTAPKLTGDAAVGSILLGTSQATSIDLGGHTLTINGAISTSSTTNTATISNTTGAGIINVTSALVINNPLTFSNSGTSLTVNISGDYLNNKTIAFNNTSVVFKGTNQNIVDNSTGTLFNNVTFQGGGTKAMSTSGTGTFAVSSTSTLTMAASTTLTTGGILTLNSDASGTACVAAIPTGASISGAATVQRYFTGGTLANRGWRLMSMPVNNTSTLPVTTAAAYDFTSLQSNLLITGNGAGFDIPSGYTAKGPTVLFYNTSSGLFTNLASIATTTPVGTGFYFYFRGDRTNPGSKVIKSGGVFATPEANVVGLQSGVLNQGSLTYPLSYTGTGINQGVNLVGNPYPSSYNVTVASLTNTNGTVYTFTPGGNSVTANPAPFVVGSGEGFYVKATNTGSTIAFTEANKVTTQLTGQNLLMGIPVATQEGNIKLQLAQDSANYDFAQLRFLDTYNKNYDEQEDADDLNGNGQAVFFGAMTADNHLVAIASQPLDKQKTSVFLSVNDNNSGLFSISKVKLAGIPDKYDVWLMDHFKNDSLDLRNNSTYNFNIDKNNAATYGNTRLEVVIRKKLLPPYQLITFSGKKENLNNVLKWSTVNEYTYTSFQLQSSADGVNFADINDSQSNGTGNYTFSDQASNSDVYYRLKQMDINDNVTYSTIVIIKADNGGTVFTVYPNPVGNMLQFSLNQVMGNALNLRIYNSLGILIKSSNYTSNSGQQDVSMLTSGSYEVQLIDSSNKKVIASAKFMKL